MEEKNLTISDFYQYFRIRMVDMARYDVFVGNEDIDEYEDRIITFMCNVVCYEFTKNKDLRMSIESKTGRGSYSDVTILSKGENPKKLFEIEHENSPLRFVKKKNVDAFKNAILKLLDDSHAKQKILITYEYSNCPSEELKKRFKALVPHNKSENIALIIGKNVEDDFDKLEYLEPYFAK